MAPKSWEPFAGKEFVQIASDPLFGVSNAATGDVAVSDRCLGKGQQPAVDGRGQAAEQAGGRRESDHALTARYTFGEAILCPLDPFTGW